MSSPVVSLSVIIPLPSLEELEAPLPSPVGTPPGMSPVPLQRCGPRGVDPYVEDRAAARGRARGGALCAVNQHGCMYFSASEWVFCPMCEWSIGHAQGEYDSLLAPLGGPIAEHAADVAAGRVIFVTRAQINTIFATPATKSFNGALTDWTWQRLGPVEGSAKITRAQLHNLLMEYGSPSGCLTDELWLSLQAQYPPLLLAGARASAESV